MLMMPAVVFEFVSLPVQPESEVEREYVEELELKLLFVIVSSFT